MQKLKGKRFTVLTTTTIAIALLILSLATTLTLLPNVTAHDPPWTIPTYPYIIAAPNPIGVGQTAHVYMWLTSVYGAAGGRNAIDPTNGSTASGALLANNYRFHNYNLTITAPDGTTSTQIFPIVQDSTSSQYTLITPDQIGTYMLTFNYPGQVYGENGNGYENSPLMGDSYAPGIATTNLTVQQDPIPPAKTSGPMPSQYWTRPIYGENTDWWTISSNWLGFRAPSVGGWSSAGGYGNLYHQDAQGPLTSHIMWTRPLQFGGVVGGNQFQAGGSDPNPDAYGVAYFEGSSYAPRFYYPIIIQGILFYTETASFTGSPIMGGSSTGPTRAVDLRTGQEIWSNPNIPQLSFGYLYNLWNPDQHGVYPAVLVATVGSQWNLYDAATGINLFNVTGVPGGTSIMGPSGEQLNIALSNRGTSSNPAWYLSEWNMSKLWLYDINPYTGGGSLSPSILNGSNLALVQQLPLPITGETATLPGGIPLAVPYGSTLLVNANIPINDTTLNEYAQSITTYDWNISIPWLNGIRPNPTIVAANYGDMLLCRNGSLPTGFAATGDGAQQGPYTYFGINLNASRGAIGSMMWMKTYDPPPGNVSLISEPADFQSRVFTFTYQDVMQWVGYNLDTGEKMWGPTASQAPFDYYGNPGTTTLGGVAAYGHIYSMSFSGILYAYDILTGNLDFTYGNGGPGNSTNAGFNVFYGDYPTQIQSVSNGVVYCATDEHTVPNPIYKGATYRAINATTGEEIWVLSGYPSEWAYAGSAWATADGFLTCMNGYDQQIYSIGRGPSKLTVEAPDLAAASGQPVVIHGTITDIAAGTLQPQQAANFPNGVPVAADSAMTEWMGYVYQQMGFPTNFTGVPVTISVVDSNGNFREIGTATSTSTGTYSLTWIPDIPGDFTVFANFAGTNAYWPSTAMAAFNVMSEHPTPTPSPTPPASNTDMYVLGSTIGIIVTIIIVGAVVVLMQRKRTIP